MEDHREVEQQEALPEQVEESLAKLETEAVPLPILAVETRVTSTSPSEPVTRHRMCPCLATQEGRRNTRFQALRQL